MRRLAFTLLACAVIAAPALAVPTLTVDRVGAVYDDNIGGGELRVVPDAELMSLSGESGPFYSFCMEMYEAVDDEGTTTYNASILTEAILGNGNNGPLGPTGYDALDPLTAWLYQSYRDGTLTGYNDDNPSAAALQQAIWFIEDEYDIGTTPADLSMLSSKAQGFVGLAIDAAPNDIGNVRVLHLWTVGSGDKPIQAQDLLITVPAPGAILLGSLGVGLVGWMRRRRSL